LQLVTEDPRRHNASINRSVVFVTGDGPHEGRLCKGFTSKFDGHDIFVFSLRSPQVTFIPPRKCGLASLEAVHSYMNLFQIRNFIWVCDKEHFDPNQGWIVQIANKLAVFALATISVNPLQGDAVRLDVTLGPKHAVIWCALIGLNPCGFLEENLARLIQLEFHEDITADKQSVATALGRKHLRIEELVNVARMQNLRGAFLSLFSVFADVESRL
jgi:hypothetical protein